MHHIKPVRERPDLRLVPDNCVPLCGKCHQTVHREG
ncbi:HNH endonuclease [Desulfolucanica intricata]